MSLDRKKREIHNIGCLLKIGDKDFKFDSGWEYKLHKGMDLYLFLNVYQEPTWEHGNQRFLTICCMMNSLPYSIKELNWK